MSNDSSISELKSQIETLKDKLDVILDDNKNLQDEIHMAQSKADKLTVPNVEILLKQEREKQEELEKMTKKVENYLELTEELEENGVLDDTKTDRLLQEELEEKERMIKSISQDLEGRLKELERLRQQ